MARDDVVADKFLRIPRKNGAIKVEECNHWIEAVRKESGAASVSVEVNVKARRVAKAVALAKLGYGECGLLENICIDALRHEKDFVRGNLDVAAV